jgi:hypothetical protein
MTRINTDVNHPLLPRMFDLDKASKKQSQLVSNSGDWKIVGAVAASPGRTESSRLGPLFRCGVSAALRWCLRGVRGGCSMSVEHGPVRDPVREIDPAVHVTLADLPQQIETARPSFEHGLRNALIFPHRTPERTAIFPEGYDVIWMSEFLDCFSEEQITSISAARCVRESPKRLHSNCCRTASPTRSPRSACNRPALFHLHRQWQQPNVSLRRHAALPRGKWSQGN